MPTTKDTKSTKKSENKTLNAIFQPGVVEIDEQPDPYTGEFHVGQQLGFMYPLDRLDAFEFDDQLVFDQHVDSKSTIEPDFFVMHRLWVLELELNSIAFQLISQTLFVGGFQQPRTENSVYFNGTADHAIGKFVEVHLRALRGDSSAERSR